MTRRALPTSTGRQVCLSAGTRCAIPVRSSTRTTRSSAGSPTAAVTGSTDARARRAIARRNLRYDHFEVLVDDRSRRAVVVQVVDESAASAALALETALSTFAHDGITVELVLTDNGWAYRSHACRAALESRRHSRTRPYRPQTKGKAERFIGTLVREWAYARPYWSNAERLAALPGFVDFYNQRRPHTALGGLSPAEVVNNVRADHT
jgi:transposase InsO family protein